MEPQPDKRTRPAWMATFELRPTLLWVKRDGYVPQLTPEFLENVRRTQAAYFEARRRNVALPVVDTLQDKRLRALQIALMVDGFVGFSRIERAGITPEELAARTYSLMRSASQPQRAPYSGREANQPKIPYHRLTFAD